MGVHIVWELPADVKFFVYLNSLELPDLPRYLATTSSEAWPFELWVLRSQLLADEDAPTAEERAFLAELREHPEEEAGWQMYSDWLEEQSQGRAGSVLLRRALERVGRLPLYMMEGLAYRRGFYASSLSASRRELEEYVFENARLRRANVPSRSTSSVSDHQAELLQHYNQVESPTIDIFVKWHLFDAKWTTAHPRKAGNLLRSALYWNEREHEPESSA